MGNRSAISLILFVFIALFNIGGCNLFSDLSDKNFDAAILDEIENSINSGKYTTAIEQYATLSAAAQAKRANKFLLASAYAGRSGLNVIDLALKLGATGNLTFFERVRTAFVGKKDKHFWDAVAAREIITAFAPLASDRTINENIFILFDELAVIGTILASTSDLDEDGNNDPFFDNCRVGGTSDAMGVPDIMGVHMVLAIANIISSIQGAGTALSGLDTTNLNTYLCSGYLSVNFCTVTSAAMVTTVMIKVARTLIGETNLGIGLKVINPGDTLSTDRYEFVSPSAGGFPLACP